MRKLKALTLLVLLLFAIPSPLIFATDSLKVERDSNGWQTVRWQWTADDTGAATGETTTEDEIIAFCKEYQASYKAPKAIVFLDELPKTGSGKIYKKGLRDPFLQKKK